MTYIGSPMRLTFERRDVEFSIECDYSVSGRYRPARLAADPGDSYEAEYPELEVHSVHAVNVRTQKPMPKEFRLSTDERERLERDLMAHAERANEPPTPDPDAHYERDDF